MGIFIENNWTFLRELYITWKKTPACTWIAIELRSDASMLTAIRIIIDIIINYFLVDLYETLLLKHFGKIKIKQITKSGPI